MKVLAHRGVWRQPSDKNAPTALSEALRLGFGVETDVRDYRGQLVVSHDPPGATAAAVDDFLAAHQAQGAHLTLALNIKADGLRSLLRPLLAKYAIADYFCFDMSVPETLAYSREGVRFFTRESEFERHPALYDLADGVWMDMFQTDWIATAHIERHLQQSKRVALVSPELHGRPHLEWWDLLRSSRVVADPRVMLCTDHPQDAQRFFHD